MKTFSRDETAKLLTENIPQLDGRTLYIMGGGNTTQLFQEGLKREFFYDRIEGYCNSRPENQGKLMFGKPCVSPESLRGKENILVLINTPQPHFIKEMKTQLRELEIPHCLMEEAVLKNHAEEVLKVYDLLCDAESKNVYANMLWCRLKGEYPAPELYSPNQYFLWNFLTSKDTGGTFADCGAFVGDSMERYIWYKDGVVNKIWCFEPDPNSFRAMRIRAERLKNEWNLSDDKIKLLPYGVSDKSSEGIVLEYSLNNGLSSKIAENTSEGQRIKIAALDDIIDEKIDFLKADIESFEYKMLLGAEKTIKKYYCCPIKTTNDFHIAFTNNCRGYFCNLRQKVILKRLF